MMNRLGELRLHLIAVIPVGVRSTICGYNTTSYAQHPRLYNVAEVVRQCGQSIEREYYY